MSSFTAEGNKDGYRYHLPVVAAFLAWVLGALRHLQYAFRARWTQTVGQTTMNVYSTAMLDSKRRANSKVVQMDLGAVAEKERGCRVAAP